MFDHDLQNPRVVVIKSSLNPPQPTHHLATQWIQRQTIILITTHKVYLIHGLKGVNYESAPISINAIGNHPSFRSKRMVLPQIWMTFLAQWESNFKRVIVERGDEEIIIQVRMWILGPK